MKKNILCIGGANIDLKLKSEAHLFLHTSNQVTSSTSFGGVARNVAHNLAKVTTDIHLQCVVGNDEGGRSLLEHMRSLGVNTSHSLILDGKRTSQYLAVLNDQGELFIGLADMAVYDEINEEFITASWDLWTEQSLIFIDTNLPAKLIDLILKRAALFDIPVCIDPVSVEKAKKLPYRLDSVFLIKPDMQEASALTEMPVRTINDCLIAGRKLKERGVKNTVISMGKSGYVLVNDDHEVHVPVSGDVQTVDVSGAGDAFIAGILHGLQQNKEVLEACTTGAKAAELTIQSVDTVI
ncbi:carbohydrate kinase family protein [Legionella bononiensis]|uniref:Carbohydrate kinase family protein n=1 Tax=Legionella bononiensis TaxID=2793102 RepID=A0ABS1W741_9GAMM|nr:carbohydrate kinase family protein [Legionella bononiensis]MBL7481278.1 carbohydrate kinase family protein [Legionella bononiensis]MBL7525183.1 carbohydrate kinase family protein [Legionella bononiensis]MBL7561366.1 carbohydrate kinase family protein [Legionella bononiensis]